MPTGVYKRTEKMKKNISKGLIGRECKQETKDKIGKANRGRKRTQKQKDNVSIGTKIGMKKSGASKKISKTKKGVKLTQEHKDNIKTGMKKRKERDGYINSLEARKKLRKPKSKKGKRNIRLGAIQRIKNTKGQIQPNYNRKACVFFKMLNKKYNLKGFYAENKGEFYIKELGYFLDFYSKKYNLVIEWNEADHYNEKGNLNEEHRQRQCEIKRLLKCHFINIRQKAFNEERIFARIEKIIN